MSKCWVKLNSEVFVQSKVIYDPMKWGQHFWQRPSNDTGVCQQHLLSWQSWR